MQRPQLERPDILVGEWAIAQGPRGPACPVTRGGLPVDGAARSSSSAGAGPPPSAAWHHRPGRRARAFRRHYFDGRGEARVYEMTSATAPGPTPRRARSFPQRFRGTLDAAGTTISASCDGGAGRFHYRDIRLTTELGGAAAMSVGPSAARGRFPAPHGPARRPAA